MKKLYCVLIGFMLILCINISAFAEETLCYDFEGYDNIETVTNTLSVGGSLALDNGMLMLDGTCGLKLGEVTDTFTVSAMVKITSNGGTNTIFFKDMDGVGNKWTGILSKYQRPSFWTHGDNYRWTTVADGTDDLSNLSLVTYVENEGIGTLYVNGTFVGEGNVEKGNGTLYLGVTYWTADAVVGIVDSVKLFDHALTEDEVIAEFEASVDYESSIKLPKEAISDITLPVNIGTKTIVWETSDEAVIDVSGKVTRYDTDKSVTLTAFIDGEKIKGFEIKVLKKPYIVNNDILLSYVFDENDGDIIHDISGNGNHGEAMGNLSVEKDGADFDGVDDYVKMPEGVLYGHDEITIAITLKPNGAQKHVFAYGFGNGSDAGYMFLNPSRPDTNYLRFAATKSSWWEESEIVSLPGVRNNEWATVTVVISDNGFAEMYVDGDLVMDGNLGISISDLGETKLNYIAKSLYDGDPYFAGIVSEFTVYNYCMRESEIKELYGKEIEYDTEDILGEYIQSVSFEDGIDVEVNTLGRDDVKIGVAVIDKVGNVEEFVIFSPDEEIIFEREGTVCVFAFDEEHNTPGNLYVKGRGEGFGFEYTPGKVSLTSDESHIGGTVIIAGYDIAGTLTGTAIKKSDLTAGVPIEIEGDFDNAVRFKMLYWNDLETMIPVE